LRGLALIAAAEGDLNVAQSLFGEVLSIGRTLESGAVIMSALWGLGDLAATRGDVTEAEDLLRQALQAGSKVGYSPEVAAIQERLTELAAPDRADAGRIRS
jgi:hypothetical protein